MASATTTRSESGAFSPTAATAAQSRCCSEPLRWSSLSSSMSCASTTRP